MKICSKCKLEKDYSCFNKNKSRVDGYQHVCNDCRHDLWKKDYLENKQLYLDKNDKRRNDWRNYLDEFRTSCKKCNESCKCVLDFHHKDNDKDFDVTRIIHQSFNEKNKTILKNEISKCIILCANCHRKVHNGILKL